MRSLLFVAALAWPATAAAAPCSDLANPVYIQAGDTQEPLLKNLGRALADNTPHPIDLVYVTSGSCSNVEGIYTDVKLAESSTARYVPSSAADAGWNPSMPSPTCTITTAGGQSLDIANSALFVSACDPEPPPAGIALFQGPVQAYLFAVPEGSTQTAITAEEAYLVFGFGGLVHQIAPWIDSAFFHIRTTTKSTLLTIAAAIGVPGAQWKGTPWDKSSEVVNALKNSPAPDRTIGILGAEVYDAEENRSTLNALAFRAYDQFVAYYPDSTTTSFDKANVRDGHYTIWSPTVWLTHVDSRNQIVDPDHAYVVGLILGHAVSPAPNFNPLPIVMARGLIPDCAMKVTRSYEGGPLSLYDPAEPCHCFWDSINATNTCAACSEAGPCATGTCRNGFCEAK